MNSTGFYNINYSCTTPAAIREHSLCMTPSTEGEIADYLGDVFSEEVCRIFLMDKGYLIYTNINYLRNASDNINFVGSFYPLNMGTVEEVCSSAIEPILP